jgi:hypothetical protein
MKVRVASLGLVVLSANGCTFLDEVDRSIEQKVLELDIGVTEPKEPPPPPQSVPIQPTPVAPADPAVPVAPVVQAAVVTPPGTPKVAIKPVSILRGELTAQEATRIIERHKNELRFCYAQSATGDAKIEITFVVSPTGSVQSSGIEKSDVNDERLLVCLIQAVKRWTFPASANDLAVVTVPLELSRVVDGGKR